MIRITKTFVLFGVIVCFVTLQTYSQETIITGKITDSKRNEAIPFANIYFNGTTTGTISDFEGNYILQTIEKVDSLTVSCVGYTSKIKFVREGVQQKLDFQLNPSNTFLSEIIVKPGENPAHRIVRAAMENKKIYSIENLDSYQSEAYSRTEVSMNNISERFKQRRSMKPLKPLFDSLMVSSGEDGSLVLPIMVSETMSDIYYLKNPPRRKEILKASKVIGVGVEHTYEFISQVVGTSFHEYNFNSNWLKILDKNVMSPIATGGFNYYKYYLTDSLFINGHFCYEIQIVPKRTTDVVFHGTMWIQDTVFALKRIAVEIKKSADLNFIEEYKVQQDLRMVSENIWGPFKTRVLVDFSQLSDSTFGMLGKFLLVNRKYKIDKSEDLRFYKEKLEVEYDAYDKAEDYWQAIRPEKLTETEQDINNKIDSIKKFPRVKTYIEVIETLVYGYYRLGKVEMGPYLLIYGNNVVEGNRFRLGFRTNADFSRNWILKGYLAYGTKDNKLKYSATVERFLSRKNWTKVGVTYKYDVEGLGVIDRFFEINNLFTLSTQVGLIDKMRETRLSRIWFESDVFRGFNQKISLTKDYFAPLGNYVFEYFTDDSKTTRSSTINITELTFVTRYSPRETFIVSNNQRIGIGGQQSPAITVSYTLGLKGFLGGDFNYHKLSLKISQKVKLFALGRFRYEVEASMVFNQLPYPILQILPGNETFIYSMKSYNMMNFLEFVTDQNINMMFMYNFEGAILGKIPLLKKLKWRALASTNIVYGSVNKENGFYDPVDNPDGILPKTTEDGIELTRFSILYSHTPYVEVSYGVENIFKIIRIQVFHRLTYLDETAPHVGVKGSLFFMF